MVQRFTVDVPQSAKKEDKFVSLVGEFGRWQFLIFSTISLVKFSSGTVQMAILFLTPNLVFWCEKFANNSRIVQNNTCYKDCVKYSYDTSPFEETIVSEWDLVCERRWLASFTQMLLQFGILIGSIIFGFFSDRYGRKVTFLIAIAAMILIGFGIPFAPGYTTFTVLRFLLGVATAGTMVVSFVIIMESIGNKYREVVGCLFQIPFIIGHISVPVFAYYFRRWSSYTLALAVPPLIYLGYFFLLSESPRWLVSVGKVEEATRIVKKAALINNLPTAKIEDTLKKLAEEITSTEVQKPNYSDLFRKPLLVQSVSCCAIWLVTGVTFFGFNQYISQSSPDPFVSVAAAGAIQIPSNLISIWLIRKLGRKVTTTMFSALGGLCIITLGCVPDIFWLTLTLGTLGVSCTAIIAATIYIYTSELYPTVVRNMALGACSTSMRVGSMLAPFISNLSVTAPWLPTLVFGVAPLCSALVCLLLPETKGKTLLNSLGEVNNGR